MKRAMNHSFRRSNAKVFALAITLSGFVFYSANAQQQLQMSDFVLFGGSGDCPDGQGQIPPPDPGCAVQIGSNSTVTNGAIGSYSLVKTLAVVNVSANIHSDGSVIISDWNTINGNITAANSVGAGDAILQAGKLSTLNGNLDINGDITIESGSVGGIVTHPAGTIYSGPVPVGGEIIGAPSLPILPQLPTITSFPPAGNTDITSTQSISPGSYGNVLLTGYGTLTFSGTGVYVFNSMKNNGMINTFTLDFQNSTSGTIKIYVYGDVDLGRLHVNFLNGGDASRVYMETHGTGSTCQFGTYAWSLINSTMGGRNSEWFGTVWAPYAGIRIGAEHSLNSADFTGALWSATQVNICKHVTVTHVPFVDDCSNPPNADAGIDKQLSCFLTSVHLEGSSSTPDVSFSWQAGDGGHIVSGENTSSPLVDALGTYTLTVTDAGGCSSTDETEVTFGACILPYYPPPAGGKIDNLIGSELDALHDNFDVINPDSLKNIFFISNDSVWIEVITNVGHHDEVLALLQTTPYGLTNIIDNGPNSLIITGKYPVANLLKLDSLPDIINYVRPVFPPLSNSGVAYTLGDVAQTSDFARNGFNVSGEGVKVGVLSDSYNTLLGDNAHIDILNDDLPGVGNPDHPDPVQVLKDYPYGIRTDEGRAMLQIVHDIAPDADLAFRTGFISAGDFAQGIRDLQQNGCNVIVDDVTYITEPFFQDGQVAQAVDEVANEGVAYFSAAGNFGSKSYAGTFNPAPAPNGLSGVAHDFSGTGDVYQHLTLPSGNYTIVLQWADSIYSMGQTETGTRNDLDIFITDPTGTTLFGFNRFNTGGDPIEVLPFTVTGGTATANLVIVKSSGPDDVNFKYAIFQGEATIDEYNQGTSTVVAQANADGAIAVGAVLYSNTPAFGVDPPTIASFSSTGGTPVNGVVRNKPDIAAPNGGNTTVYLGGVNIDGDQFPNFFGTSAAAPHAAGAAALLIDARNRFYNETLSPTDLRSLLQSTAIDMATPGFDYTTGYGFIQAGAAMLTFAAPTPVITSLVWDTTIIPGTQPLNVNVDGTYFTTQSQILFRGEALPTTIVNSNELSVTIPEFTGNPPIQVYTPPITPSGSDGGYSNELFFFSPIKKTVSVTADNKSKKFGEKLPLFTATILVNGQTLDDAGLTLSDIGLDSLKFQTPATSQSNTGIYFIRPSADSSDIGTDKFELYNYDFVDGLLTIDKMPLKIRPNHLTLTYGDKIEGVTFNYDYDSTNIDNIDRSTFFSSLTSAYEQPISNAFALVDARVLVNGRPLVNSDLEDLAFLATSKSITNARPLVNAKPLVNSFDTTLIVDVAVESVFNYEDDSAVTSLVNAKPLVNARALVNAKPLVNGTAVVNAKPLVNGSSQVNSSTVGDSSSSDIAVIIDEDDVNSTEDTLFEFFPIVLITGTTVGDHTIVPAAMLTNNFDITYELDTLTILPATLTVTANDTSSIYGETPSFTSTITGFQYSDIDSPIISGEPNYTVLNSENEIVTGIIPGGTFNIAPSDVQLVQPSNYVVQYENGTLNVGPAPLTVTADLKVIYRGDSLPSFTSTITGFIDGGDNAIASGPVYTVSPTYQGLPGVYDIIPSGLLLEQPDNYSIDYVAGPLYVNPKGNGAEKIRLHTECVDTLIDDPSGYTYIAHFSYRNENSTPVYVPLGPDNFVAAVSGSFSGEPPQLFMPGTGSFDVLFNGQLIGWTVKSYEGNKKKPAMADASSATCRCGSDCSGNQGGIHHHHHNNRMGDSADETIIDNIFAFPNPTTGDVTISFDGDLNAEISISVIDLLGKEYPVETVMNSNGNEVIVDLTRLSDGAYFIRVKANTVEKIIRVMKQ